VVALLMLNSSVVAPDGISSFVTNFFRDVFGILASAMPMQYGTRVLTNPERCFGRASLVETLVQSRPVTQPRQVYPSHNPVVPVSWLEYKGHIHPVETDDFVTWPHTWNAKTPDAWSAGHDASI
jgi:hypothetical protein